MSDFQRLIINCFHLHSLGRLQFLFTQNYQVAAAVVPSAVVGRPIVSASDYWLPNAPAPQ